MAKKESKSKAHTRNLVGGMRQSNSQSKTPISSLYPKKVNVGTSKTAPAHMQKGTSSPAGRGKGARGGLSGAPQKFLLSVTNPGPRPNAPTAVPNPGASPENKQGMPTNTWLTTSQWAESTPRETRLKAYTPDGFTRTEAGEAANTAFKADRKAHTAASSRYVQYQRDLNTYNTTTLPNWQTASTQYTSKTSKNVKTTSKYSKDVTKFLSGLSGKVSYRKAKQARGSRNTSGRPGGSRA